VEECDAVATGPDSRALVDQAESGQATGIQSGVEVRDPVTDVVDAGSPLGEKLGDGTLGVPRLEQFDLDLAERQRNDLRAVRHFTTARSQTQDLRVERQGGIEVLDRDAHVGDSRGGDQRVLLDEKVMAWRQAAAAQYPEM
jgi:hypothetical protein